MRTRSSASRSPVARQKTPSRQCWPPTRSISAACTRHIGSQIFDTAGFEVAAHRVIGLAATIRDGHGVEIAEVNLGGGLGIAYVHGDDPESPKQIAERLQAIVERECAAAGLRSPRLTVEPGRAIVGPSAITVYEVGTVKDIDARRGSTGTYVSVDGGMSDNIRTALYDAAYTCTIASRVLRRSAETRPRRGQALREWRRRRARHLAAVRRRTG